MYTRKRPLFLLQLSCTVYAEAQYRTDCYFATAVTADSAHHALHWYEQVAKFIGVIDGGTCTGISMLHVFATLI